MITCNKEVDKHIENSIVYDNKAEEKTLIMSAKKEKHVMVMFVCMDAAKNYYIQRMNAHVHQSR